MKKYILFMVILFAATSCAVYGQVYEKKTVQSGQNLGDYTSYLFPSFSNATVKFKIGGKLESLMNFNMFICKMAFIDPHGDTLNLARPAEIDSIYINNNIFFFRPEEGYYQVYPGKDSARLAALRTVSYAAVKIGALGIPSRTGTGIVSYSELVDKANGTKELVMDEDVDVTRKTVYYIINLAGQMTIANKSNFLKMFDRDKKSIEAFIKTNKIDFNKDADLLKLINFCNNHNASTSEAH
jgi:hypothetical protein